MDGKTNPLIHCAVILLPGVSFDGVLISSYEHEPAFVSCTPVKIVAFCHGGNKQQNDFSSLSLPCFCYPLLLSTAM